MFFAAFFTSAVELFSFSPTKLGYKDGEQETQPFNPQQMGSFDSYPVTAPPPLPPPRHQFSNLQQAQLSGLPLVKVRADSFYC